MMPEDQMRADTEVVRHHMAARFSCRGFRPDPVPEDVITDIFDVARWAASWNNLQLWDDMIVTRPETTRALSAELLAAAKAKEPFDTDFPYPEGYSGVYLERRREVGYGLYKAVGIERNDYAARERQGLENFRFFGAPHVALLTVPAEQGVYGVLDAGGFVTAFMLAAQTHGVASIAQAALASFISPPVHFTVPSPTRARGSQRSRMSATRRRVAFRGSHPLPPLVVLAGVALALDG